MWFLRVLNFSPCLFFSIYSITFTVRNTTGNPLFNYSYNNLIPFQISPIQNLVQKSKDHRTSHYNTGAFFNF